MYLRNEHVKQNSIHIMKYKTLFMFVLLICQMLPVMAIDMRVGETQTLSIGNVPGLQGCQWTISRPNDIIFVTTPRSLSTDVVIKAVNTFPSSSPCIVSCVYYYNELDPISGRYIYQRQEIKDWTIFVGSGSGSGSESGGGNSTISLSTNSITTYVGEWSEYLTAYTSSNEIASWRIASPNVATYMYSAVYDNNTVNIRGESAGETVITATLSNGASATCKITVLPRRNYKVGDVIVSKTTEGAKLKYKILSVIEGTCQLGDETNRTSPKAIVDESSNYSYNTLTIPEYVDGFKVVSVSDEAFKFASHLSAIRLPSTIRELGKQAFGYCYGLTDINIPEGVTTITDSSFDNCTSLKSIILPNSVTTIEKAAFHNCKSLSNVVFPCNLEAIGAYAFSTCALEMVDLPQSIQSLGSIVFYRCYSIKAIILRNNILSFSEEVFSDCKDVDYVRITETEPLYIKDNNFNSDTYTKATLCIPYGTSSIYQQTGGWNKFYSIEEKLNDGTAVASIVTDDSGGTITNFNLQGQRIREPQRGVNIIRYSDGTTKKVLIK